MPEPVDDKFKVAMERTVKEHMDRRANTIDNIEVMRLGRFRWRYRFYWGRHVVHGPTRKWYDYESGVRITRQWALIAAARHLTKLQTKHSRTWEPKTGRP